MTRRPDSTDWAQARERMARMTQQPVSAPSPDWKPRPWRPLFWGDLPLLAATLREASGKKLDQIIRKLNELEKIIMSDQDTLNAVGQALADLSATVASDDAGLAADVTAIQAEIAALQAVPAGTPLDFTAVNSAVSALQGNVASNTAAIASAAALVPAPPAPPVTPPVA